MIVNTIIILKGKVDLEVLRSKISQHDIIYALDNDSHKLLYENSIHHEIADKKLAEKDFDMIFDRAVSLYKWYENIPDSSKFDIDGMNFFSILDTMELHDFLVNFLYDFVIIKRILEQHSPKIIVVNSSLKRTILSLHHDYDFDYEILKSKEPESMTYESIEIKLNMGKMPFSLSLSRNNYLRFKNFIENVVCRFYNLWPDQNMLKRSMLFVEMDPSEYEFLIAELVANGIQVLFLNNRKPATWNRNSVKILRRYDCKVIGLQRLLTKDNRNEIEDTVSQIKQKIIELKNNTNMEQIFTYEEVSFWNGINDELLSTFENRAYWYICLLKGVKKILSSFNLKCILSINVVGETEKTVLALNRNIIPSFMLEHAFANYLPEISRYDILSMYPLFKDRIVVWGEIQKSYLIKQHNIEENRIIVAGSPRHDVFFTKRPVLQNKEKVILITPRPIIATALHKKVELYQQYERLLEKIIKYFGEKKDIKIIIKTHPGLDLHNSEIKKIIQRNNSSIPIYQSTPIKKLIEVSYAHINISPEGFDLSTVILESLILGIPVMNITLDEKSYDFEIHKMNAIMNVWADSSVEKRLDELIFDKRVRETLVENGQKFLQKYLSNMGKASKYLAKELMSLKN